MHRDKHDRVGIERLLALPELAASLRRNFEQRLAGVPDNPARRLEGLGVEVG
jgi:hypothetical protein